MADNTGRRHSARMPQTLTPKQVQLLSEVGRYAPLDRHACDIAQILLHTGMSADELAQLHWTDVDFEEEILRIRTASGNHRTVRMGYYVKELFLVWSGPMFSEYPTILGRKPSEVLDAAERRIRQVFEYYSVPGVDFRVIQNTSAEYGYACPAEPEPAGYVM